MNLFCPMCNRLISLLPKMSPFNNQLALYSTIHVGSEEIPVITYPVGRQKKFIKKLNEKRKRGKIIIVPKPGKVYISTNERRLNLYTNEFPTKFEPPTLSSQTWTSHKSPGRFFTIHSSRKNPSTDYSDSDRKKFEDLELSESIINKVENLDMTIPTNIQTKAIPEILKGKNVMIAAETGSGKTHSYLLPIMHLLMEKQKNTPTEPSSPEALILTPSKELSQQVTKMARMLDLPLKIENLDDIWLRKSKQVARSSHLLITTPILAMSALRRRFVTLDTLQAIVVDECDTLLDESFSKYVCNILGRMNILNGVSQPLNNELRTQLILCSATFPKSAEAALKEVISISDISLVSTGYMHRISPHVTHKFLRVRPSEKLPSVVNCLQESVRENSAALVFCNKKSTVHWLSNELVRLGLNADRVHSGMTIKERVESLDSLRSGKRDVLVCTDLSSRGMDTQMVQHVINYDFPSQASDYIHRSGRVGRVGQSSKGTVTSFISKKWEVPLVMKIEEAARRRERVGGVNADIKSYHKKRWDRMLDSMEGDSDE